MSKARKYLVFVREVRKIVNFKVTVLSFINGTLAKSLSKRLIKKKLLKSARIPNRLFLT